MEAIIPRALRKAQRALARGRQLIVVLRQFNLLRAAPCRRFALRWADRWVHLRDATSTTAFDRHYIFHTAWAARVLADTRPEQHVDIGSSLYFVTSVSAFVPTTFIDFRRADLGLSGLDSRSGTLLALPFTDNSVESISCMHVVEHVGLGRYGDALDYDGDLKAMAELTRVVAPGGHLLLVVPVGGEPRIQFNAHRIYSHQQILAMAPGLELKEFALIPDDGAAEGLVRNAPAELAARQRYGCGCYLLHKPVT